MIFRHDPMEPGTVFGRLTVVRPAQRRPGSQHRRYECVCDCGTMRTIPATSLRTGRTKSCGCIARERIGSVSRTHGQTGTALYRIWNGMMGRCRNPKNKDYPRYGGRGIKVCERWCSFENFFADMPPRPSPRHSIGRLDNSKGYEPGNVRWETPTEQQNNLRSNHRITRNGETLTVKQWADRLGINDQTIHERIKRGWPIEKVLSSRKFKRTSRRTVRTQTDCGEERP
jgi:hypothetical protein